MKKIIFFIILLILTAGLSYAGEYHGNPSDNPYDPNSTSNPSGAFNVPRISFCVFDPLTLRPFDLSTHFMTAPPTLMGQGLRIGRGTPFL